MFTDFLYIESDNRISGIRVEKPAHGLSVGIRADIAGSVETNSDGERYIDASAAAQSPPPDNTGNLDPLGLHNFALGGKDWLYYPTTGAGQKGVAGASSLNNIGLLIRTWGQITQIGSGYLYMNDGSNLNDGTVTGTSQNLGVRVVCDPAGYMAGDFIGVTGISSCFRTPADEIARRILTRGTQDIEWHWLTPVQFASVGSLKHAMLGRPGVVDGSVVVATSGQIGDCLYVEDPMRISGLRIDSLSPVALGDTIRASGVVGINANGEVELSDATVEALSHIDPLAPLGMNTSSLGGGPTGLQGAVTGGFGLSNTGILVRSWGYVVEHEPVTPPQVATWFVLDDSSGYTVKCVVPVGLIVPDVGHYAQVTGISSCYKDGDNLYRLLRVRDMEDIKLLLAGS